MLFNSFEFFIFFPVVTILFFVLPQKFRWLLLLTASCVFYMAFVPIYILILFITIIIDYFAGIAIENSIANKKNILIISIVANVGLLAIFKYFNFLNSNIQELATWLNWNYGIRNLEILLPIGLSFHTFQAMSYTIEVYKGKQKAERHFGIYALYVMFFPQLVAGPIERPQNIIQQLKNKQAFDYGRIRSGLLLMGWGFFKKIVIADRMAEIVDVMYTSPESLSSLQLILCAVCFSFQIYCDFSGYSDIAIGSARILGIKLMKNFNNPYFSQSISEFWSRWHISLSTWFRDYLYIPMGGNKISKQKTNFNKLFVFFVSGLWHGANWTFIFWGGIHGVISIAEESIKKNVNTINMLKYSIFKNFYSFISWFMTFTIVTIAWIFFRSDSLDQSFLIIKRIFILPFAKDITQIKFEIYSTFMGQMNLLITVFTTIILIIIEILNEKGLNENLLFSKPIYVRWSAYLSLLIITILCGKFTSENFIYFQF